MIDVVTAALPLHDLASGVGVTVCEITQISTAPEFWRGGSGGTLIRHVAERPQPQALTDAIARMFSGAPAS